MVRHTCDAGTKDNVFRHWQCLGNKQIRVGDVFPLAREVLAYPGFFVTQPIEFHYLIQVIV